MPQHLRRQPLPFLCVAHSFDHMFMLLYPTVVLALEAELNRSYGELLNLSIGGFVMFGLGAPLAGWLADRWSGSGMLTTFFVGIGFASIATGLMSSALGIALGLGLIGLFASIYHPVGIAMVVQTAGEKRGRHLGINGVFGSVGMAVAALVAGTLTDLVGWRAAFIVPGVVSIAVGIAFAVLFRHGIDVSEARRAKERPADGLRDFVRIMAIIAVLTVFSGLLFQALTIGLPKFLDQRVDFLRGAGIGVGAAATAILLLGGAAQLLGGALADRFRLKQVYFRVYSLMVPVMLFAAIGTGVPLMLAMVLALAITVGIQPVADTLFARYVPPQWLSTAFGLRFALSLTVSALAVPLVGLVFDATGDFLWLFLVLAAFAVGVIAAVALLPSRAPGEAERRPAPRALAPAE